MSVSLYAYALTKCSYKQWSKILDLIMNTTYKIQFTSTEARVNFKQTLSGNEKNNDSNELF